jgi:hypothetical protein
VEGMPENPSVQKNFEQDAEAAVMMFHLNAGNYRFVDVDKLDDENEDVRKRATERLIQEINEEVLSHEDREKLMHTMACTIYNVYSDTSKTNIELKNVHHLQTKISGN